MQAVVNFNNSYMQRFLERSGLFEIVDLPGDASCVFVTDHLDPEPKGNFAAKIFVACDRLQDLPNLTRYAGYDYYIGFGTNLYDSLGQKFFLEFSKVLNGFVHDQTAETEASDDAHDLIFISSKPQLSVLDAWLMQDAVKALWPDVGGLSIAANVPFSKTALVSGMTKFIVEKVKTIDRYPANKVLNRARRLFFLSAVDGRRFMSPSIFDKSCISGIYHSIVHELGKDVFDRSLCHPVLSAFQQKNLDFARHCEGKFDFNIESVEPAINMMRRQHELFLTKSFFLDLSVCTTEFSRTRSLAEPAGAIEDCTGSFIEAIEKIKTLVKK